MERDTGYDDGEYMTETCRQCGDLIAVRPDEERAPGSFFCDDCVRRTTNRAARLSPLSNYLWDTSVTLARLQR